MGIEEAFDADTWPSREYVSTPGKGKGKGKGKKAGGGKAANKSNPKILKVAEEPSLGIAERKGKRNYVEETSDDEENFVPAQSVAKKSKADPGRRKSLNTPSAPASFASKRASYPPGLQQIVNVERNNAELIPIHDNNQQVSDDHESVSDDESDVEVPSAKKNTPKSSAPASAASSRKKKQTPLTTAAKKAAAGKSKNAAGSVEKRNIPVSLQFVSTKKAQSSAKSKATGSTSKPKSNNLQPPTISAKTSFSEATDAVSSLQTEPVNAAVTADELKHLESMRALQLQEMQIRVEKEKRDADLAHRTSLAIAKSKLRKEGVGEEEIAMLFADV